MEKRDLLLRGMQGFGDNIHQRALVRQLKECWCIYLETSSPFAYHDLLDENFHVVLPESRIVKLWTQIENVKRERTKYSVRPTGGFKSVLDVWYTPSDIRHLGSVMAAMCVSVGCDPTIADFRMPVPSGWRMAALGWLGEHGWNGHEPIMVMRPLVERPGDWTGCPARNPDFDAYHSLYAAIREKFFVVSVAKLKDGVEWQVGHAYAPDAMAHAGELPFEAIAGLIELSTLCYGSPGYIVPMAQAIGRPVACVFGGYENGASFSFGRRFAPYLPIEPVEPCQCFKHDHACKKAIDLPLAKSRLIEFADAAIAKHSAAA